MWGRRILYTVILLGCLAFYGSYKEWLSWVALLTVFFLPWLSLALSLPAMLTVKAGLRCPKSVRMGMPARTGLELECKFPFPPVDSRIRLRHSLTGAVFVGTPGEIIPTEHCGVMTVSYDRLTIYDYLGLFSWRPRRESTMVVYIEPKPVPAQHMPEFTGRTVSLWRPKPGGGFSENHELRLYRPGDDLRNLHWKMSAKTGKLIYREPIEPVQKGHLISLTLTGDGDTLDRKLGQLLWVSNQLLSNQLEHTVRCRTGSGVVSFFVRDKASLDAGMETILHGPTASEGDEPEHTDALWQHQIGGDSNED